MTKPKLQPKDWKAEALFWKKEALKTREPRTRLSPERSSIVRRFNLPADSDGKELKMYVNVGLYDDGRPGEVFIKADKVGSFQAGILDALAIAISIALQYGAPISLFIEKFVHTKFEPAGLTGDASFPMVSLIFIN